MKNDYQKKFLDSILNPEAVEVEEEVLGLIKPAGNLSQRDALNVYRGDYLARMQEALGKNYEATWVLMGDEDFMNVSSQYIYSYPSTYTNLTAYGELFPNFLERDQDTDIVVMANFEKIFWSLFNQKGNPAKVISPEELPIIMFDLQDSIYLFESSYQLYQLWQKREEANSDMSLDDFEGKQYLAVFKQDEKVAVREISQVQYYMLKCFSESCGWKKSLENIQSKKLTISEIDWSKVFTILSYAKRKNE